MKRALFTLLMLGVVVSLVFTACASPTSTPTKAPVATATPTPAPVKVTTLKFATHAAPGGPQSDAVVWWADEIAKRTNGQIKIQIYWSESLAKANEINNAIQNGTADMGMVTYSYFTANFPLNVMSDPVGFKPDLGVLMDAGYQFLKEYPQFEAEHEKVNQKLLAISGLSSYQLSTKKSVQSLEDFKGLKVRTWGKYVPKWWQATGAVPTTVTGPETYEALQKGILDASPIAYELIKSYKWYEVAKYVTEINMGSVWGYAMTINLDTWKKLPPDVQKVLVETGPLFSKKQVDLTYQEIDNVKKTLKDAGVTILQLPAAERDKWKNMDAVKGTRDEWVKDVTAKGFPGQAMMDRFLQLIKY